MKIKVYPGQTIFDLSIEQYGSVEAISFLIEDNLSQNKLVVGDLDISNQAIEIRKTVVNQIVVDYHLNNTLVTY